MNLYDYGCELSPYDARDYKVCGVAGLPDAFELDFSNIRVKNQGSVSSCVAHAMSTILEYYDNGNNDLSTNFIYGLQKELCNNETKGMYLRDACKIATKCGDALEDDCPGNTEVSKVFDIALAAYQNEEIMERAAHFKTKAYCSCSGIEEIKTALINNGPVLISIKWYKDYKVKNGILVDGYSEDYGYHALVVYGYNEQGFLVQNSWGKNWGNKGRFILPYDIKIAEARSLIDIDNDSYIAPDKPNKFMEFLYKLLNNIVNFIRQLQTN